MFLLIMARDSEGLQNKLEGVNIGSLLLLQSENGDIITGFVRKLTSKRVKLSHESPANSQPHSGRYPVAITMGNREYHLRDYNQYKVLDTNFTE